VYVARGLTQFEPEPEDTEQLQRKKVSIDEAYALVKSGEITDAITVAAVQAMVLGRMG
jgi:hypothetical protein